MNPLISIIVPIYNSERYLDRCIKSILEQTYENLELILVNDGSTDNSLSICEKYKLIDDRIKIINKQNGGVSSARNSGIDIANGDLIGFVDSDDYVDKTMYSILKESIFDDIEVVALISHTIKKTELLNKNIDILSGYEALSHLFRLEFPTSLWAYLYRKEIIGETRLSDKVHFLEDFEFNTKILMKAKKVNICKDKMYNYEINDQSINSQKVSYKKISCLEIYDELIKEQYIYKDPKLKELTECFRSHFLLSVVLSISKSLDVADDKYFVIVKNKANEMLYDVWRSRFVPFKYKTIVLFTALMPSITIKSINVLKKVY